MLESPHQNRLIMENFVFQERNILQPREREREGGEMALYPHLARAPVDTNCYCDNVMGGGRVVEGDSFLPLIIV